MTAIELLKFILEIFRNDRDNNKIIEQLLTYGIIYPSFEMRYLVNNIDFDFELTKTIYIDINTVEYYLEANDGSPCKMELFFEEKWYLKSFLFQCQGCFGNDEDCLVCGGSGWGVL